MLSYGKWLSRCLTTHSPSDQMRVEAMVDSTTTIRTVYFRCQLPRSVADALNRESGRIYTQVLVEQYRIYRKKGVWLSPNTQKRYNDYRNDQPSLLHAHSIDAA